jgi:tRNA threonylcarbamoyladenosine biosynthesis protein TsaB
VIASKLGNPQHSHSNSLLTDINEKLEEAGVSLRDVDLFAAASGPGSFTGLRIGLATTKALAATLERPCVGIPTLQAIAHAAGPSSGTVALLPAGRGEVFVQLLSVSTEALVSELDAPAHLSPRSMLAKYDRRRNLKWCGEGAEIHKEIIRNYAQERAIQFREESLLSAGVEIEAGWKLIGKQSNLAKSVAALALNKLRHGELDSPSSLRAIYVRPSDAELKEQ